MLLSYEERKRRGNGEQKFKNERDGIAAGGSSDRKRFLDDAGRKGRGSAGGSSTGFRKRDYTV